PASPAGRVPASAPTACLESPRCQPRSLSMPLLRGQTREYAVPTHPDPMSNNRLLRPARLPLALCIALAATPVLAAPAPAPAPASEPSTLDTVVVTATGYEQKIVDAPASISVITREDLAQRPYITLLDAVRDLEGV